MQRGIVPVLAIPYNYKKFNCIVFLSNYLTQYKTEDLSTLFKIIRLYNSKVDIIHLSQGELLTQDQDRNVRLINNLFTETPNKFIDLKGEDVFKEVNDFIKLN